MTVNVVIHSVPAGAKVLDKKHGVVLGVTPLEKAYPRGRGDLALLLQLDGHKERALSVSLNDNYSASVDLEPADPPQPKVAKKPDVVRSRPVPPRPKRSSPPTLDDEREWRVH